MKGLISLGSAFDFTARTVQGQQVTQFAKPLEVQVQLGSSGVENSTLYYYNTIEERWTAMPSSFNVQQGILTATTDHFTTFVAANAATSTCRVGEGEGVPVGVTEAFKQVYQKAGGEEVLGSPEMLGGVYCTYSWFDGQQNRWKQDFPDRPGRGKSSIIWSNAKQAAYLLSGEILRVYADRKPGDVFPSASWLGDPISEESKAPTHLVAHDGRFGGEPILNFERGFISRYQGTSTFNPYAYHPAICDVNVSITKEHETLLQINVSAKIVRAPGWPTVDQRSDPLDAYFTVVRADGTKQWVGLTQNSPTDFSTVVKAYQWAGPILNFDDEIHFYLDAYNRKWENIRTFPKEVVYQQGWPMWDMWAGSTASLFSVKLTPGTSLALKNDNPQCEGVTGDDRFVPTPPIAIAKAKTNTTALSPLTVDMGAAPQYTYTLDGSQSQDPDGGNISFAWDLLSSTLSICSTK